jgi:DNA-binding transcriptional LysR family regulator
VIRELIVGSICEEERGAAGPHIVTEIQIIRKFQYDDAAHHIDRMDPAVNFRHLEVLSVVAHERSITGAARKLHTSQPALSQLVRRIEEEVGVELFDRSATPLRATEAGEVFLPRARKLVEGWLDAVSAARQAANRRVVTLGATPMIARMLVPELLLQARVLAPSLDIHPLECRSHELFELMRRAMVDIAVAARSAVPRDLSFEAVLESDFLVAVPERSPVPESGGVAGEQHVHQPLLQPQAGGVRTHLENYFDALGGTPAPAFESASTDTLLGLVEGGHGICLVLDLLVGPEVRERFAGVRFLRMASGPRPLEMGITKRPGWQDTPAAMESGEVLRAALTRQFTRRTASGGS